MKLNIQLFADGMVIIKTSMDNREFFKQLKEIENTKVRDVVIEPELNVEKLQDEIYKAYEKLQEFKNLEVLTPEQLTQAQELLQFIEKANDRIHELGGQRVIIPGLNDAKEEIKDVKYTIDKLDLSKVENQFKNIGHSLKDIIKKVAKWGLAIFGIRGAYMAVRNAMNVITQQDKQLASDIQFMKTTLAYTLEPIIRAIVNLMKYLVGIVGSVVKMLTGRDIFAQASKNLKSGASSAQQIQKSMASLDEATTLSKSSSGGAGSGTSNYKFDMGNLFDNWNLTKFIEKGKEIATNIAKGVNNFFATTDWSKLAEYITLALSGIIAIVDTFLTNIDWTLIGQSIATFILSINWIQLGKDIIKLIVGGLIGAINLFEGVTIGIVDKFKDPEFRKKLVDDGKEMIKAIAEGMGDVEISLQTVWSDIISWFLKKLGIKDNDADKIGNKMGKELLNGMITALFGSDGITLIFMNVIKAIRKILGIHSPSKVMEGIGENMADGLKGGIEEKIDNIKKPIIAVVNSIIKGINKLIDGINKISFDVPDWVPGIGGKKWGFNIKKISEVKLAKGGIVNMPGRGVPVGAMAGERGMEGIIPLTDSQQMAMLGEAIGRYITINANIPVNMNGRLISREIRKVQNDNSFATNGGAL